MPVIVTVGLLVFGAAGIAAGFMGVPRRVFDVSYGGLAPAAWSVLMALVGIGATIFAVAISITVYGVIRTLLSRRAPIPPEVQAVDWHAGSSGVGAVPAWTGPVSVAALVIAMYAFTIIAFQLIQSLPIIAIGGGHGH
jgi:cytochrome c oxidase subunit 1